MTSCANSSTPVAHSVPPQRYRGVVRRDVPLMALAERAPALDVALCQDLIRGCFESEDYTEGRRAFIEKRSPVFTGK